MFVQDLRLALRALRRSPAFSIIAIVTMALGIGGTAAVFTVVNGIVLRPLPYPAADRLVVLRHAAPGLGLTETPLSDATYLHYRSASGLIEDAGFYYENVVNVTGEGDAERVQIAMVSPSLLTTLGARPIRGRTFEAGDAAVGPDDEVRVVISHDLWTRRYGADPTIVGRVINLNSAPRLVIGVLERGFHFPRRDTQIWYADRVDATRTRFADFIYSTVARLRPGVAVAEAQAELNRLNALLPEAYPDVTADLLADARFATTVTPLSRVVVGNLANALWLLLGGMVFVLLIACTNVANLFLVRAEHRQKEVAVRSALGASRAAIVRYFLSESVLLGAAAGVLALAIADSVAQLLVAFGPATLPRLHEIRVDATVLGFTALLALTAALVFAAVPAVRYGRPRPGDGLRQYAFGATTTPERQRFRQLLVVAQVALALTLVVGSALMVQSFWKLRQLDPGFEPEGVLTAEIALPFRPYPDHESSSAFWSRLLQGVRELPGVREAGAVSSLPLVPVPEYYNAALEIAEATEQPAVGRPVGTVYLVTPGYFEAMRIPVLEGEAFTGTAADARDGVIVSAALARRLFPGESAIGRRLRQAERDTLWNTIVGVVGDVPRTELAGDPAELLYVPVSGRASTSHLTLAIRTATEAATLAPAVRVLVRELDPELPVANVRTMQRIVDDSMARTSFAMVTLLTAGALALFLGAVGIYGVIAYSISRRFQEIGVRMALGARAADIRSLILRRAAAVALIGIGVGTTAALGLTRFLRGLLFDVSPTDPLTLATMAAALLGVALLAAWIPAHRVSRIEPLVVLRLD